MMRAFKLLLAIGLFALVATGARAQSSPNLIYGQVPTAAQWNSYFAAKQDNLGYSPLNRSGDTMLGRLSLFASSASNAGFNIGVATDAAFIHYGHGTMGDEWKRYRGVFELKHAKAPIQSRSDEAPKIIINARTRPLVREIMEGTTAFSQEIRYQVRGAFAKFKEGI